MSRDEKGFLIEKSRKQSIMKRSNIVTELLNPKNTGGSAIGDIGAGHIFYVYAGGAASRAISSALLDCIS